MRERDLQGYLFDHPEVLFPDQKVLEKHREYPVGGKRVDLFFRLDDGCGYIVELKKVPITREHLGQVVEYYGLLRGVMASANLRMILVSPQIPAFRKVYLHELGIRCVEMSVPETAQVAQVKTEMRAAGKAEREEADLERSVMPGVGFDLGMVTGEVTQEAVALVHRAMRDLLVPLRRNFADCEIMPFRIDKAYSPDIECVRDEATNTLRYDRGRLWWAFRIGHAEEMPKNDLPNFSIIGAADGLELCVNAELRPAQEVVLRRLRDEPGWAVSGDRRARRRRAQPPGAGSRIGRGESGTGASRRCPCRPRMASSALDPVGEEGAERVVSRCRLKVRRIGAPSD
jgi:hypothetical protein